MRWGFLCQWFTEGMFSGEILKEGGKQDWATKELGKGMVSAEVWLAWPHWEVTSMNYTTEVDLLQNKGDWTGMTVLWSLWPGTTPGQGRGEEVVAGNLSGNPIGDSSCTGGQSPREGCWVAARRWVSGPGKEDLSGALQHLLYHCHLQLYHSGLKESTEFCWMNTFSHCFLNNLPSWVICSRFTYSCLTKISSKFLTCRWYPSLVAITNMFPIAGFFWLIQSKYRTGAGIKGLNGMLKSLPWIQLLSFLTFQTLQFGNIPYSLGLFLWTQSPCERTMTH